MIITSTKLNGIVNPVGYGYKKVIASWKVEDTAAKKQTNALVEVALDADFSQIVYKAEGAEIDSLGHVIDLKLAPCTRYFWRVTVTGDNGEVATSDTQYFETGKMKSGLAGQWIAAPEGANYHPTFVHALPGKANVAKARLYVSALGVFEAYVDGKKVGDEVLTPYINDYDTAMQIITFDVTDQVASGKELEIVVANGWYRSNYGLEGGWNFGDTLAAIAELYIEYADGSHEVIATDETWGVYSSDVTESGIYYGEDLDRRIGRVGSKSAEDKARVYETDAALVDRYSIPVVVKEVIKAKEIITTPAGETVIDFGQNHAGVMEFDADFPAGTVVTFDCGEVLQQGNFYNDNYRDARSRFVYTSDGVAETVSPRFTFFGYRYLRVQGWVGELTLDSVRAKVLYSDMERTGFIETSNAKINRLYENCIWGQKSNFLDHPTDCPQRDERLAWTGDAQVFSQTASYNMDTRAFYRKFLRDLGLDAKRHGGAVASFLPSAKDKLADCGSIWSDVSTFVPTVVYNTFGSLEDVAEHYDMMVGWVEYMHANDVEHGDKGYFILPFQFGDWLGLDGVTEQSFKGGTDDNYLGAAYYYKSTLLTAEMADRLGKTEDAAKYHALADKIYKAILAEYFSPNGRLCCDTQAAYIVALAFDIYIDRDKLIAQFIDRLNKDCMQIKCGFVGAPLLCTTLAKCGRPDLAYHFLFNEGFPSWLYCVNLGATTIWERWNSILEDGSISGTGMNSLNHYSYGTVVQFMYEYIAGIKAAAPGFRKATIAPTPSMKFRYFNCSMNTAAGKYVSNWSIAQDGTLNLHIEVPFGGEALVTLPRFATESLTGIEAGQVSAEGQVTLTAGSYDISYMPSADYRYIYSPQSRLSELAGDEEAMALLKEKLPQAYGIIMNKDKENMNLTLGELQFIFFMGFTPELVNPVTEEIYKMNRW